MRYACSPRKPAHRVDAQAHWGGAKRIVTFFRDAAERAVSLPLALNDVSVFALDERHAFSAYMPSAPQSLALIEKTFGKSVTTRTWDTVRKCVAASIAASSADQR